MLNAEAKMCSKCRDMRPLDEFVHNKNSRDEHGWDCMACRLGHYHMKRAEAKLALAAEKPRTKGMRRHDPPMPVFTTKPVGVCAKCGGGIYNTPAWMSELPIVCRRCFDNSGEKELKPELKP